MPWAASAQLLAEMDAARQLSLSRHFAAFLGAEHGSGPDKCDEYRLELLDGPSLSAHLAAHGPLQAAARTPPPLRHLRLISPDLP